MNNNFLSSNKNIFTLISLTNIFNARVLVSMYHVINEFCFVKMSLKFKV